MKKWIDHTNLNILYDIYTTLEVRKSAKDKYDKYQKNTVLDKQ
jgi:hypothetical protein